MTMREMTRPDERMSMEEFGNDGKTDVAQKGGTASDEQEMRRMGKVQELRRNFKFIGIVGFVTILQATWQNTLLANQSGLTNGGTAGVIWCTIAVWILMLCTIASMAEMASMCPTAGGQYHWVSEFAPPSLQKPLSYVVGWCCCLGWIAGIPACGLQLAGLVQAMVILVYPKANVSHLWQTTLLVFLFVLLCVGFNIFFAHHLPLAEGIVLFLHIFAFFAFLLVMWIMADHVPAAQVFTEFHNGGGWSSLGLSCLVGLTTPIWCFIGPDAGAHMSEELKDASLQLPKAMIWATFGNGIMGIGMLITFCFCITDLEVLLDANNGLPVIQVLSNATGSKAGTIILGSILLVLLFFSTVTTIASASRQVWAFSRDCGLPFSAWIRYVPLRWEIPLNALLICLGVSLVLSAINFGSYAALNAILSVSNAALIFSYIVSIGCVRLKRLRGEPLLPRRWSLGKWGAPLNDIALLWLCVGFVFSFFPSAPYTSDPDTAWWAGNFNWSIVIFSTTCILALIYFACGGSRRYVAPLALVKAE
ncbi:hypothetical protein LTR56_003368 [Elasticomyces elasticus]|nr:hypothetical protein LTR56_003368 [Elasticomyces elasticus]KAK3664214.1 hypothetical protein LTR22_004912 [Elasticomyces elasticus]KAK4931429.1 hypothetical protein LTR49_002130 [Elasticomyces elasticus]KAK5766051.1 hypothetical protein LTS12_003797 [Elasticomyces elasticus]